MNEEELLPCLKCVHFKPISGGCRAFPDGIPNDIANGERIHNSVELGQQGTFVFEEGEPYEYKEYGIESSTS